MQHMKKAVSILIAVVLIYSLSMTALAGLEEKKIIVDGSSDGYVTVNNITSVKEIQDNIIYYASSPITITFYGSDLMREMIIYYPNAVLTADNINTGDLEKLIDFDVKYDEEEFFYVSGNQAVLEDEGVYYVIASPEAAAGASFYVVISNTSTNTESITATPTSAEVLVNGASVAFEAYTIDGNNYFKLRDMAKVLDGTIKQFEVSWDGTKRVINLISGSSYTTVGGELAVGDQKAESAVLNSSEIYKDGAQISLAAYTINGNNYFKLRDIGEAFDFGVTWDGINRRINIDTSTGYQSDITAAMATSEIQR